MSRLVAEEGAGRDERWRAPSVPKSSTGLSIAALAAAVVTVVATWFVLDAVRGTMIREDAQSRTADGVLIALGIASLILVIPALKSVRSAWQAQAASAASDIVQARVLGAAARTWCWFTFGYAAALVLALLSALFVIVNDLAVGNTFFRLSLIADSFDLVLRAFWRNVYIFMVAEVLVLVWGLIVAIARMIPGQPGQPIRLIATVYTDTFRGLPAIISIYMVGFGLPLTGLPLVTDFPPEWYAILALTLTYGAYVAEVYRAGIDSIHWSQTAAARSLGLSFMQTLRFVIVPQAVRRIIPPLLNDFVSLQKDTALVNVIGVIDAFNQAKIIASNHFSLSPVTTVALLFVVITIPQARFVDRLIERDRRRMRAGG